MDEIKIIQGGIYIDNRGQISYVNDFSMGEIERFIVIRHESTSIFRAWHAHKYEKKWFYVIKGSFTLAFVKIDNWDNPSPNLIPEIFHLSSSESNVLYVPGGYAIGLKAKEKDSMLIEYSNKSLQDSLNDSWRFDNNMWINSFFDLE